VEIDAVHVGTRGDVYKSIHDEPGEFHERAEVVQRLLAQENAVRVFREYRGLSREQLAEAAGIEGSDLARIEQYPGQCPWKQLVAVASALRLDIMDLT